MAIQSWIDRLTDETNPWFSATKLEDSGNYADAFKVYLKDSSELLSKNQLCSAALSCSCAAHCVSKIGDLTTAHQLYLETAMIYEKNADSVIGTSVRECLWSLQESYEHYLLAAAESQSQRVLEKYVNLVRKINPISGEEEALEILKLRRKTVENKTSKAQLTNLQIAADLSNTTKEFIKTSNEINNQNEEPFFQLEKKDRKNKLRPKMGKSLQDDIKLFRKKITRSKINTNSLKIEQDEFEQELSTIKPDNHLKDEVQLLRKEIYNYEEKLKSLKIEKDQYKQKLTSFKPNKHPKDEVQIRQI